jgi:hypothetical protein
MRYGSRASLIESQELNIIDDEIRIKNMQFRVHQITLGNRSEDTYALYSTTACSFVFEAILLLAFILVAGVIPVVVVVLVGGGVELLLVGGAVEDKVGGVVTLKAAPR